MQVRRLEGRSRRKRRSDGGLLPGRRLPLPIRARVRVQRVGLQHDHALPGKDPIRPRRRRARESVGVLVLLLLGEELDGLGLERERELVEHGYARRRALGALSVSAAERGGVSATRIAGVWGVGVE